MSARARLGKWLPSDIEHPLMKMLQLTPMLDMMRRMRTINVMCAYL